MDWTGRFRHDGNYRRAWLVLARQSERISLYTTARNNAGGTSPATTDYGKAGNQTSPDRPSHSDRLRAFILAVSDYANVAFVLLRRRLASVSGCRKQALNLPDHARHFFLIRESDHEKLIALVKTNHPVGE